MTIFIDWRERRERRLLRFRLKRAKRMLDRQNTVDLSTEEVRFKDQLTALSENNYDNDEFEVLYTEIKLGTSDFDSFLAKLKEIFDKFVTLYERLKPILVLIFGDEDVD